ncbi:G-protein coupled receptor Mth [Plutella xylostella]|uniref:G-protein coupled receptor Mth n=1 Tax=Plutella xylostella TaxID=51655 RepID=UPI002032267C|nr:G-protein coupled receptor Mth [Plutella xylostella]
MYIKLTLFLAVTSIAKCWTLSVSDGKVLCDRDTSVDISQGVKVDNGILYKGVKYGKGEYYFDSETQTHRGCICKKKTCVQKCCPFGFGYDPGLKNCTPYTEVFDPPIWDEYHVMEGVHALQTFHLLFDVIECMKFNRSDMIRLRVSKLTDNFHIRKDGKLHIESPEDVPPWTLRTPDKYCVDTFVLEEEDGVSSRLDALVCFSTDAEDPHNYLLSAACMLISCVFILATLAVYAWLPELRNLYGKVLMAYLSCLLLAFLLLGSMQVLVYVDNINTNMCLVLTFFIYFSMLSAFFWLNVMCFDIYWTFSGKRGLSLEKLSNRGRFLAYSTYAFGVPSVLTALLIGLEFSGMPVHPLMPALRHHGCFIHGNRKLLYLYGPILLLSLANIAFFTLTTIRIAGINRQTSVLQNKESATHDHQRKDKQRLLLYVKLFSVMGVSWILEVFSALYPEAQLFWQFTDSYNALIGVSIFVVFVCKRKIFRLIKKRIRERFHKETEEPAGTTRVNLNIINVPRDLTYLKNYQPERNGSLDTIKTTLETETDSKRSSKTSNLCDEIVAETVIHEDN